MWRRAGLGAIHLVLLLAIIITLVLAQDSRCTVVPTGGFSDENALYLWQTRWLATEIIDGNRTGECWEVALPRVCPVVATFDPTARCTVTGEIVSPLSPFLSPIFLPILYRQ